jgi:hypothetical protein
MCCSRIHQGQICLTFRQKILMHFVISAVRQAPAKVTTQSQNQAA